MKILLLGEFSNVHWALACGLRQLGHEAAAAGDDPVLSPVYFSKQTALLPVYPDLLAVRDRGHREIRRNQGRLAGV